MIDAAGTIFTATVIDVHGALDENDDNVTYTTFLVDRPIKGAPVVMRTIKQFGGEAGGLSTHIMHMRYFTPGERVLVMLYPESHIGFTSPIGMNQGVWNIGNGMVRAVGPTVLEGLGPVVNQYHVRPTDAGLVPIDNFIALINGLIREGRSR